jgi:UDP-GlcNAc:undecaprenyl-phosphate/decaprenyl-phosphate GlcNAc-1-phosphate transferase
MTVAIYGAVLAATSVIVTAGTIGLARRLNLGADSAPGVQRFHSHWVPRLGGVPIALCMVLWLMLAAEGLTAEEAWLWIACLAPAFVAGLLEDLSGRAGPWARLALTMAGAVLAWVLLDVRVTRLGAELTDHWLVTLPALSLLVTMLFVGGAAHALNIIDGYNGLAGSYVVVVLCAIGLVAMAVDDARVFTLSAGALAATLGFLALNFPYGRIFLGDGGAYLLGTLVAFLLCLLVARNPQVSPWFAAVLLVYPVWETLFSMYRKIRVRGQSAMQPDGLHLHMLLYKRLVRTTRERRHEFRLMMNAATTLYLLAVVVTYAAIATGFWHDTAGLVAAFVSFIALYIAVYMALVRFRMPRVLSLRHVWFGPALRGLRRPAAAAAAAVAAAPASAELGLPPPDEAQYSAK